MNRNKKAATFSVAAGAAVGAVLLSGGLAEATPVAGAAALSTTTDNTTIAQTGRVAGANQVLADLVASADTAASTSTATETDTATETTQTSDYENVAIANVDDSVNVRAAADTNSDVVGKLYTNNYAEIESVDGDWYKITSGNVSGYVHKDYLKVNDEQAVKEAGKTVASVNADTLYVRTEESTDAQVLAMTTNGEELTVTEETDDENEWIKVSVNGGEGYVAAEYVEVTTEYTYGETSEEIAAREAAEAEAAAQEAAAQAAQTQTTTRNNTTSTTTQQSSASTQQTTTSYAPASGSSGSAVVAFASQFLGNPYVYGGTSLTNGCDCSGFVMSVYANFGVSLPHSSSADRGVGYGVDASQMQPGDIVCYSGHVGIYAGGGVIINAATEATGIKYTNVNYAPILAVRRIF